MPRRRKVDFGMKLSELGKPDESFYVRTEGGFQNIVSTPWREDGSPGFAKWTVQAAPGARRSWMEREEFFCKEVQVHFTGKRLDGTLFTSTREDGVPLTFVLEQDDVMQGFSLAISSMLIAPQNIPGERAVFTIPPDLAGTKSGCPANIPGNIPPNEALVFDIELISLVTVTDILDDEGSILKKTIKKGMGYDEPRGLDEVLVNYNACLEDGVTVSKSEGVEFNLEEGFFCPAFAHAVKTMREGEEAILIVKPEYGFGERGRPSIGNEAAVPPDTTLYVYLQLMSWKSVSRIGKDQTILKKTLRKSKGKHSRGQAVVRVRLIGKLQDGTVFDKRGHEGEEPFEFMVDEEIAELVSDFLEEAVLTMLEGEVALFTILPQHVQDQLVVVPPGSSVTYEIELVSVVNDDYGWSRDKLIEAAVRKEQEGDKLFSSSKFLRAYRRYYKAREIILFYIQQGKIDGEIQQMMISFALKAAECATQLPHNEQAYHLYREVLEYDPGNEKAQQMLGQANEKAQQMVGQAFPEASLGIDTASMHRGLKLWEEPSYGAPSNMRIKQGHKYSGHGMIFVPPIATPKANAIATPKANVHAVQSAVRTSRGPPGR